MNRQSKARELIEMMTEELLVNNKVRDKATPEKTGVIATISADGQVEVAWDDGTKSTVPPDSLEKMEEPVAPAPEPEPTPEKPTAAPEVGAGGAMASGYKEGFRKLKDGRTQILVEQWKDLPKGWTKDSLKSFWGSLTGDREHKVTACMKKMAGKVDDPGAFCASLARKVGAK